MAVHGKFGIARDVDSVTCRFDEAGKGSNPSTLAFSRFGPSENHAEGLSVGGIDVYASTTQFEVTICRSLALSVAFCVAYREWALLASSRILTRPAAELGICCPGP